MPSGRSSRKARGSSSWLRSTALGPILRLRRPTALGFLRARVGGGVLVLLGLALGLLLLLLLGPDRGAPVADHLELGLGPPLAERHPLFGHQLHRPLDRDPGDAGLAVA